MNWELKLHYGEDVQTLKQSDEFTDLIEYLFESSGYLTVPTKGVSWDGIEKIIQASYIFGVMDEDEIREYTTGMIDPTRALLRLPENYTSLFKFPFMEREDGVIHLEFYGQDIEPWRSRVWERRLDRSVAADESDVGTPFSVRAARWFRDFSGEVVCLECGETYEAIPIHVETHDMTVEEYKEKYPGAPIHSKENKERVNKLASFPSSEYYEGDNPEFDKDPDLEYDWKRLPGHRSTFKKYEESIFALERDIVNTQEQFERIVETWENYVDYEHSVAAWIDVLGAVVLSALRSPNKPISVRDVAKTIDRDMKNVNQAKIDMSLPVLPLEPADEIGKYTKYAVVLEHESDIREELESMPEHFRANGSNSVVIATALYRVSDVGTSRIAECFDTTPGSIRSANRKLEEKVQAA